MLKLIEDEWVSNHFAEDKPALLARLDQEISFLGQLDEGEQPDGRVSEDN